MDSAGAAGVLSAKGAAMEPSIPLPPAASSLWRRNIALRGLRETKTHLKHAPLKDDVQLRYSSCLATHESLGYALHGSSDPSNPTIQAVRITQAIGEAGVDYKVALRFPSLGPIYSLSWQGNNMLASSDKGRVFLYANMDPQSSSFPTQLKDFYSTSFQLSDRAPQAVFTHSKLNDSSSLPSPSPEQWAFSDTIRKVALNPLRNNVFLSLENNRLHVWDLENEDEPLVSIKGSSGPLFAGQWNPHAADELMVSGATHTIKLLDYRLLSPGSKKNAVVWKRSDGHTDAVRDIKWSPLIPHWVATAGNDGVICVWDRRFDSGPVMRMQGHNNAVTSVSWSRIHAEVLASGGTDQQVKLWSLRVQPHHVLASCSDPFGDALVGTEFSNFKPMQVYGLSSRGEFATVSLTPKFLEPLVFPRFSTTTETEECEIEKLIYMRHFSKAFEKVIGLASKLKHDGSLSKALSLLELCTAQQISPLSSSSSSSAASSASSLLFGSSSASANPFASLSASAASSSSAADSSSAASVAPLTLSAAEARSTFSKELDNYSYFIPPNFPMHLALAKVSPTLIKQVEDLKLNIQIMMTCSSPSSASSESGFAVIAQNEHHLLAALEKDVARIEPATLKRVAECYARADIERAVDLALKLGSLYEEKNRFALFDPVSRAVLSPTIFDASNNATLRENASKVLGKTLNSLQVAAAQLILLRSIVRAERPIGVSSPSSASASSASAVPQNNSTNYASPVASLSNIPPREIAEAVVEEVEDSLERSSAGGEIGGLQDILPQRVLLPYLRSLLALERFDDYFGASIAIQQKCQGFEFSSTLQQLALQEGVPSALRTVKSWSSSILNNASGAADSLSSASSAAAAVANFSASDCQAAIVRMLKTLVRRPGAAPLPEQLRTAIASEAEQLMGRMMSYLEKQCTTRKGAIQATSMAREFLDDIADIAAAASSSSSAAADKASSSSSLEDGRFLFKIRRQIDDFLADHDDIE